jgi:hypothetical protein
MKELNDKFERQWKEQFQDADRAPDASVWDRIDAGMASGLVARYKKKLFYYKMAVAASVLLAVLFGSYSLYTVIRDTGSSQLVQAPQAGEQEIIEQTEAQIASDLENTPDLKTKDELKSLPEAQSTANVSNSESWDMKPENTSNQDLILDAGEMMAEGAAYLPVSDEDMGNTGAYEEKVEVEPTGTALQLTSHFNVPYEKPGRKYVLDKKINPYEQPIILTFEEKESETDPKRLWAGLNVSSGFFNPNISYDSHTDMTADASPNTFGSVEQIYSTSSEIQDQSNSIMSYKPEESSYRPDISISYGLDFGYKFSKRFVVLSGMGYQHNYGSTTVNTYIEPTETHAKYANHAIVIERANPDSGLNTYNELNSEVELNSTFEFVTIPVNIGYYLIDRKFKWVMTAGLTTDIFIRNNISDSQDMFDRIQYKTGEDSPYNPLYFNGKFGTMLHYTFLKNYQVSLEPSYRIGLSSLTKENAAFNSRPSSFVISAGIAYVF